MKIREEKRLVETLEKIYVAEDGTEFEDANECSWYEAREQRMKIQKQIESMEIKKLENVIPINNDWASDQYFYRWYNINNDKEFDVLKARYGCGKLNTNIFEDDYPAQYPAIYAVEIDPECNDVWYTNLEDIKNDITKFLSHFGLKIAEEKDTE